MYIGEKIDFAYTGGIQEFVAPNKGLYLLEAWGARGGDGGAIYGYGGYSKGYVVLDKNERIYIVVGGAGGTIAGTSAYTSGQPGGYNGGGYAYGGNRGDYAGSGGGATHFARSGAVLSSTPLSDVFIIAGGGGGGYRRSGTQCNGGAGGGLTSGGGRQSDGSSLAGSTQTSGGPYGQGNSGHTYAGGGGGGGYFGGYASLYCGASGGSGYIDGAKALTFKGVDYVPETTAGGNGGAGKASITYIADSFREIYLYGVLLDGMIVNGIELDDIRFPEDLASSAKVSYYDGDILLKTTYIDKGKDVLRPSISMEKPGYVHVGWSLEPDGVDIIDVMEAGVAPINLYAVYYPTTYDVYVQGSFRDDRYTSGTYSTYVSATWSSQYNSVYFDVDFKAYQTGKALCRITRTKDGFGDMWVNDSGYTLINGYTESNNIEKPVINGQNLLKVGSYSSANVAVVTTAYIQKITLSNPKPWV